MGKEQNICDIKLRNVSGVPVIEIVGVMNQAAVKLIEKTISQLSTAGHYNLVLNVKRAITPNLLCLESLADCVNRIREHYGVVQLVVEPVQAAQLSVTDNLRKLFRISISEGQAFQRIKGLMRPDENHKGFLARLWEKK